MNKNDKKYFNLLFSIVFLLLSFFYNWYAAELFHYLFIFGIFFDIILFTAFNYCFIKIINNAFKGINCFDIISLIVLLVSVLLFVFFPFREAKVKCELSFMKKEEWK